jgi:hypothetical protein
LNDGQAVKRFELDVLRERGVKSGALDLTNDAD